MPSLLAIFQSSPGQGCRQSGRVRVRLDFDWLVWTFQTDSGLGAGPGQVSGQGQVVRGWSGWLPDQWAGQAQARPPTRSSYSGQAASYLLFFPGRASSGWLVRLPSYRLTSCYYPGFWTSTVSQTSSSSGRQTDRPKAVRATRLFILPDSGQASYHYQMLGWFCQAVRQAARPVRRFQRPGQFFLSSYFALDIRLTVRLS